MSDGRIITFYSYKGGTGRTMAVANTACLLADRLKELGKRVLAIDWDLEAPGLHLYFKDILKSRNKGDSDSSCGGVISLFTQIDNAITKLESNDEVKPIFERLDLKGFTRETSKESLDFLPACGSHELNDSSAGKFDWRGLFEKRPSIFREFAEWLLSKYDYVLIDSRTGVTDFGGICTTLIPDTLVVVFTPTLQSLTGLKDLVSKSVEYRKQSEDIRPLIVFPLVSRIDSTEEGLIHLWRRGGEDSDHQGFQPLFEELFRDVYGLDKCNLDSYFDNIQIQYVPEYSFGERIAVLQDQDTTRLSLGRSFESFLNILVQEEPPWQSRWKYDELQLSETFSIGTWISLEKFSVRAAEVISNNNLFQWRQIKLQVRRQMCDIMITWRDKIAHGSPPADTEALLVEMHMLFQQTGHLLMATIIGLEAGTPWDDEPAELIRDFTKIPGWKRDGITVATAPDGLLLANHYVIGAFLVANRRHSEAIDLLRSQFEVKNQKTKRSELRKVSQYMGWTKSLGGDYKTPWSFVLSLYDKHLWLRNFFRDESEYKQSVRGYQCLASILELAEYVAGHGDIPEQIKINHWDFDVPPKFMDDAFPVEALNEASVSAIPNRAVTKLVADSFGIQDDQIRKNWKNWAQVLAYWFGHGTRPFMALCVTQFRDDIAELP